MKELFISPRLNNNNLIPESVGMGDGLYWTISEALERVQLFDPYCIVAGGCLRDTIFGKPVNDVDLYVNCRFHYTEAVLRNHISKLGFGILSFNDNDNGFYGKNDRIQAVATCDIGGAYPVQLIFMMPKNSTFQEVGQFDVNISKVYTTLFGGNKLDRIVLTWHEWKTFSKDGLLRVTNRNIGFDDPYVQKIKAKYAEFEWKE